MKASSIYSGYYIQISIVLEGSCDGKVSWALKILALNMEMKKTPVARSLTESWKRIIQGHELWESAEKLLKVKMPMYFYKE